MHVAPAELRSVRSGRLLLRFAMLGDTAFVLVDVPEAGSAGTRLEEPCEKPHWAFVVDGSIEAEADGRRQPIESGTAFHLPAGLEHRIVSSGPATLAAFEPVEPGLDVSDEAIRARGYEVVPRRLGAEPAVLRIPSPDGPPPPTGEIEAVGVAMGERIFTRARFGLRSGYTSGYCDLPHWGLVTSGSLVVEGEQDVELVTAGEVYACPPGPPGHRLLAADEASLVDFTPSATVSPGTRLQGWRPLVPRTVERRRQPRPLRTIPTAPIV